MEFKVKLCGVVIRVVHTHAYIRTLCREYVVDDAVPHDFSVSTDEAAMCAERALCTERFSDGVIEATCLHREVVRGLTRYGVILMHSAVVAVDGRAYVFMAKSGVGKSTHIRLWREVFGERAVVVNGDKPFFSFENDVFTVHGSPWKGKEGLGEPMSVPVGGICFLTRGEVNEIRPATGAETVDRLFHQVLLPKRADELAGFMALLDRVVKTVPFYILRCNMDPDAARVSYVGMASPEN